MMAGIMLGTGIFAATVATLLVATDRIKNQSIRSFAIFAGLILLVVGLAMLARLADGLSFSE